MDQIRYIHAADLHLDTPFSGIAKASPEMANLLRAATFSALNRLTQLCLAHKPDFLVLAGDLYNDEEHSIKAQLKLREACATLNSASISVFIVNGNHDPLSSRLNAIDWPENSFFFPAEPQKIPMLKAGKPLALIHGASHANGRENRNLAKLFKRDPEFPGFQLGLLHCNVDGAVKNDRYAPCSIADLVATGLDAWALGHAHARKILASQPFIAYAGNTQGLHPNETGPKGCFLVTATKSATGFECQATFHELGAVVWENRDIDLNEVKTFDEAEKRLSQAVDDATRQAADAIILGARLTGRTDLHNQLSSPEIVEDLCSLAGNATEPMVWLRNLANETAPLIAEADNLKRDDLLGEVSRVAQKLQSSPELLQTVMSTAFQPLARAARGVLPEPDPKEQQKLLRQALRICQDTLEGR